MSPTSPRRVERSIAIARAPGRRPRLAALALGILGLFAPRLAAAGEPQFEGSSGVNLTAVLMDSVRSGAEARVRIIAYGSSGESLDVRMQIPRGLTAVSGDTLARIGRGHTGTWVVTLRPVASGTHEVRFLAVGHRPDGTDETECRLALTVDATPPGTGSRTHREERLIHGRRYRCGDLYLVPIDHSEDFSESAIRKDGAKPVALTAAAVRDTALAQPVSVRVVAIVNASGKPIEVRPAWSTLSEAPGLAAALRAVSRWSFKPASMRGRAINDWVELTVRVEP